MIDVFIRRFPGCQTQLARQLLSVPNVSSIASYEIGGPVNVKDLLRQTNAPFVLFIDEIVPFECIEWETLDHHLSTETNNALTLPCKGLSTIYGIHEQACNNILPSWFCLLPRKYLINALQEDKFETTDFLLFHVSYQNNIFLKIAGSSPLVFDLSEWAGQLLLALGDPFAKDYQHFTATKEIRRNEFVPPQFRITTSHNQVSPAPLIAEKNDAAFPKFSLICPVFKSDFLEEMIASVLAQTWQNWELLIIVDGPPASEIEKILVLLALQTDQRITYSVQKNKGTGPTRRLLSEQASGDFIFSIDDDDMLVPDTLRLFASAIINNPTIKVFRASCQIIGLVNVQLQARKRFLVNNISNDPFEVNQPYIIERDLLHAVGGYEWDKSIYNAGEDTVLFHKLDKTGESVGMLSMPLYLRRLSTKNLTLQFKVNEAMDHFRYIDQRFTPEGWHHTNRRFMLEGNFQRSFSEYQREDGTTIITANRFFQYQTLGDLETLTIDLEVTARCNAVCGFCPRDVMPDTKTHISLETVHNLAHNLKAGPQKQVVLCGIGESLLHPQIHEIVSILTQAGAYVAMTTNGALMTENTFRKLVSAGLKSVNFSINAATAGTHEAVMGMKNYKKVIANVLRVLEIKEEIFPQMRVHVSCVVCERNEQEVELFVEQWHSKKVTQIWLHPVNNRAGLMGTQLKSVHLDRFSDMYEGDPRVAVDIFKDHEEKNNLCKIARHLAFISSDGNMRLCAMDYRRVTSYGNINQKSLQQLHFEKLLSYVRGNHHDLCHQCDFCPKDLKSKTVTNAREYSLGRIVQDA